MMVCYFLQLYVTARRMIVLIVSIDALCVLLTLAMSRMKSGKPKFYVGPCANAEQGNSGSKNKNAVGCPWSSLVEILFLRVPLLR